MGRQTMALRQRLRRWIDRTAWAICMLMLIALMGAFMRRSEVEGLTWDRVDLSRGVLRLEITKSGRRREVPMRQRVYDVLVGRPGAREGRLHEAGCPVPVP